MCRLFSQNNQGNNGLSPMRPASSYLIISMAGGGWRGAGGEKRVVRPSFLVGDDLPLSLASLHAAGRPVAKPS